MTLIMKGDESPEISKRNMERDIKLIQQISCTPKGNKMGLDDLHLLGLHRDCSPNAYGSSQDKLEIGWGDSPEPLNIERKTLKNPGSLACKKRLETTESPKSRHKNLRPYVKQAKKPSVDVSKCIAEVQELSRKVLDKLEKEGTGQVMSGSSCSSNAEDLLRGDDLMDEFLIACSQNLEPKFAEDLELKSKEERKRKQSEMNVHGSDSAFEKVLQSFIADEDDWLSQVDLIDENITKSVRKGTFQKTKSENHLCTPKKAIPSRRSNELSGSFRRTYSSDRFRPQNCQKTVSNSSNNVKINNASRSNKKGFG